MIREAPSCSEAWCRKGEIENSLGKIERYYSWAECNNLTNDNISSYTNINQFLRADAAYPAAWRLRANITDKLKDPQKKIETYYSLANYYNLSNDLPRALRNIDIFLAANATYPAAWRLRANITDKLKDPQKKIETYYSLANYHVLSNDLPKAMQNTDKILAANPDNSDAWSLRANISEKLEYPHNKTEAYYFMAKYYNLSSNSVGALRSIDNFLNDTYQKNITQFINTRDNFSETLSKAWELRGYNLERENEAEINFSCAYALYYRNDSSNALNLLDNFSNETNDTRDTLYLRGLINLRKDKNKTAQAADLFEQALASNRSTLKNINIFNSPTYYKIIGDCLINAGKNASNLNMMSKGYHYTAKHYYLLDLLKPANQDINTSIEMNFSNHDAWQLRGDILNKSNSDAANYCFAFSRYLQKNWFDALRYTNETNMDKYIDTWILKGWIFEKDGYLKSSYWAFNNSTRKTGTIFQGKNESLSTAYLGLGRMELLYNKDYSKALDNFGRSLEKNATKFDAWINIGVALFNNGRIEEAQSIFNFPFNTTTKVNKDEFYWNREAEILASKGWFNASLSPLDNATNKTQFRRAWYNKGLAKINLEMYEAAIQDLDNAISIPPGNDADDKNITAKAWMNKAVANSSLKRYDDALVDVDHSIELNSSNETLADAYYTKGLILLNLKQPAEANQSFSKALSFNKSNPKALNGLGRALAMKGDLQGALKYYSQCISIDKNNEQAWIDKGNAERLLDMEGESLISYHKALDAIKHNRARIWCDIGNARQKLLQNDQKNLTNILYAFNKSIELDGSFADPYYNKSLILSDIDPGKAHSVLDQAEKNNPSLSNSPKFNYLRGLIYYNQGNNNSSIKSLIRSYSESHYDINVLILITKIKDYQYKIKNSKDLNESTDKGVLLSILESIKNIKKSNSKEYATPTFGDLNLMLEKLNQSKNVESNLSLAIAGSEYNLKLTDDAIQNYIRARQMSELVEKGDFDQTSMGILYILAVVAILLEFIYFLFIIFRLAKVKFGWLPILTNSIGFLAFNLLLSSIFDISRALWSLLIEAIFLFLLLAYIYKFAGRNGLPKMENAIERVLFRQIQLREFHYSLFLFILLVASLLLLMYITTLSSDSSLITLNGFIMLRYLMALILLVSIPVIVVPIGLTIASGEVSHEMRKLFSMAQIVYIAICAVPLSWIFWSFGKPVGFSETITVEDKTITLPWYTITLIVLFIIAFVYPYYKGHREYKRRILEMLKKQEKWMANAKEIADKSNSPNYSELIEEIEKESENGFLELNDEDSASKVRQISPQIIKELDLNPSLRILGSSDSSDNENHTRIDPFDALKKQVSDLKSVESNRTSVWKGYLPIFIAPTITIAISLIVPWMGIPIDQGNLSQMIIDAVSQTTIAP